MYRAAIAAKKQIKIAFKINLLETDRQNVLLHVPTEFHYMQDISTQALHHHPSVIAALYRCTDIDALLW